MKIVIAFDIETVHVACFSWLNTRAGDLLAVKFKCATQVVGGYVVVARVPNLMHIVIHSDHILEIHDTGVRVFDELMMYIFWFEKICRSNK